MRANPDLTDGDSLLVKKTIGFFISCARRMGIVIGYNQSFKANNKQITKLTDMAPVEQWKELEKQIHERSGLNAYVYNTEGRSITDFKQWANRLCPAIKATDKGLAFICAAANHNLANEAFRKKGPVIGECDAGLLKVAVPIFVGDLFLGVVGGCGHIIDHSEVESFLVHKIAGIDEDTIAALTSGIHRKTPEEVERLVEFIQGQVDKIVSAFEKVGTNRHALLVS